MRGQAFMHEEKWFGRHFPAICLCFLKRTQSGRETENGYPAEALWSRWRRKRLCLAPLHGQITARASSRSESGRSTSHPAEAEAAEFNAGDAKTRVRCAPAEGAGIRIALPAVAGIAPAAACCRASDAERAGRGLRRSPSARRFRYAFSH